MNPFRLRSSRLVSAAALLDRPFLVTDFGTQSQACAVGGASPLVSDTKLRPDRLSSGSTPVTLKRAMSNESVK
jgi:hypothetical protein